MNEVSKDLAKALATEVCKDLDYQDVYELAEKALADKFMYKSTYEELLYEYEERYDYVFELKV